MFDSYRDLFLRHGGNGNGNGNGNITKKKTVLMSRTMAGHVRYKSS